MQLYFILMKAETPINYGNYTVIIFSNDNSLLHGDIFGNEVYPYALS